MTDQERYETWLADNKPVEQVRVGGFIPAQPKKDGTVLNAFKTEHVPDTRREWDR